MNMGYKLLPRTLLLFTLVLASCNKKKEVTAPNIIIINVDDMGWKDTNATIPKTKNLEYINKI